MNNMITPGERELVGRDTSVREMARVCRALGDEQRLEIILYLRSQDFGVSELSRLLKLSDSAVSHKLRILRDTNLVIRQKQGKQAIYSINDTYFDLLSEDCLFGLLFYGLYPN